MEGTERLILMGFVSDDATPAELAELERDVRLAGILIRGGQVAREGLEAAAKLRRETGLLFEHCLVRAGAAAFDDVLEAMSARRQMEGAGDLRVTAATASPAGKM
ncbi:MAG: hypothetical protein FJZ01_05505 [Candidatus Sericytochromatia bacterium]|nr:hypothetical protein [Candidatus Tanganyikabacteria bacterium]